MKAQQSQYNLILIILSVALFSLGQGLLSTVVGLRVSNQEVGIIMSVFYLGMLVGSLYSASLLNKLGHARTFTLAICLMVISTLMLGIRGSIAIWQLARFLSGSGLALAYIIVESFLFSTTTQHNRVSVLSFYGVSLYGMQSLSQLFLRVFDIDSFALIFFAAVITALAVLPIFAIHHKTIKPVSELHFSKFFKLYKIYPAGMACSFISGILIASIYGLLPKYLEYIGFEVDSIANFMTLTLAGCVFLRYPTGYLSDIFGRVSTLLALCLVAGVLSVALITLSNYGHSHTIMIGTALFIFGGILTSMYPISEAYLFEKINSIRHQCVIKGVANTDVPQGFLLAYSVGSIAGPVALSWFLNAPKTYGLFSGFALVLICLAAALMHDVLLGRRRMSS